MKQCCRFEKMFYIHSIGSYSERLNSFDNFATLLRGSNNSRGCLLISDLLFLHPEIQTVVSATPAGDHQVRWFFMKNKSFKSCEIFCEMSGIYKDD